MRNETKAILALVISAVLGLHSTAFSQMNPGLKAFSDSQNQHDRIAAEERMNQARIDAQLEIARMDRAREEQARRAAETQRAGTQKYVPADEQYKLFFMQRIK